MRLRWQCWAHGRPRRTVPAVSPPKAARPPRPAAASPRRVHNDHATAAAAAGISASRNLGGGVQQCRLSRFWVLRLGYHPGRQATLLLARGHQLTAVPVGLQPAACPHQARAVPGPQHQLLQGPQGAGPGNPPALDLLIYKECPAIIILAGQN